MKKNYKRLIPLLLALPALMANAPVPQVFDKDYKDYELTYVSHVQNGDKYDYTYHLKNTGDGYINYVRLKYETRSDYYSLSYYTESAHSVIFKDTVLEPGFDQDIIMTSYKEIPDIKKLEKEVNGYAEFDESVAITGTKQVVKESTYSGNYYQVDLALEYSDSNWNYGAILKVNYDGNIYYVKVDERDSYHFETVESIELAKLSILDVTVIKSRPYFYGVLDGLAIVAIVFMVCFFILIGGGIFAAIFIPTMVKRKRRRRAALLAKKQQQSK